MKPSSWVLLLISAILYPLPLIFSQYLWWLTFLFAIPLFYVALKEELGFVQGFIWAGTAIGTHLIGVIIGIDGFASSDGGISRSLPGLGLILYGAFAGGIWMYGTTWIKKQLHLKNNGTILALWVLGLWCFIFFLDRLCLTPFGKVEGYFGFHPLLALAEDPQFLTLLPYAGKNILSLMLYSVSAGVTLMITQPNLIHLLACSLCIVPWAASPLLAAPQPPKPEWLNKIAILAAAFPEMKSPIDQMQLAQYHFNQIFSEHPEIEIILLPESSFYCYQLDTDPKLCEQWSSNYLGGAKHIILGAFRWQGNQFRNSVHWIYDGTVKDVFDKRHAVALTERIPPIIDIPVIKKLFFQNFPQINPSNNERPLFNISSRLALTPYICSELFFNAYPDDNHPYATILSTTNDRWCRGMYVHRLMYLEARLKAIQWHRDIVYVSFCHAAYLDSSGNETLLLKIAA